MDENEQAVVNAIGRGVVSEVAPAELAMYGSVARAHAKGQRARTPRKGKRGDDLLGFGAGEAVTLVAPLALMFAAKVWESVTDEAASAGSKALVNAFRRLLHRDEKPGPEPLTPEQLHHVRSVGTACAANLQLAPEQQALFVDALVGLLAVPPKETEAGV